MDSISEKFVSKCKGLRSLILDKKSVTGIDKEYLEFSAELLGLILNDVVWLSTTPEKDSEENIKEIGVGEKFDIKILEDLGYCRVERVWEVGEYSVLGDVIVVWPFSMKNILKLVFLGTILKVLILLRVQPERRLKVLKKNFS